MKQARVLYNLRFPGQYYDAETGLNQNWNRDYDPLTGKYIESDLVGLRGGINTYAYAAASPIQRTDRRGLDYWVEDGGAAAGSVPLHQMICVGHSGSDRFCIGFAPLSSTCLFNCDGYVYDNTPYHGMPSDMYRITDPAVDSQISALLKQLVNTHAKWGIIGGNCRDFAQNVFNYLVWAYGGEIPEPPQDISPIGP